jgi:hypothetical protein
VDPAVRAAPVVVVGRARTTSRAIHRRPGR